MRRGSAVRGGRGCWRCAGARGCADTGPYPPSAWRSENEAHLGKTNTQDAHQVDKKRVIRIIKMYFLIHYMIYGNLY